MGTLTHVSNAELNTDVESEIINITTAGTATLDTGVLVLDEVDSGTSVSVSPGDELKVKLTSSTDFVDSRYAVLDLDGELFVFQVITKRDPSLIYNPTYKAEPRFSSLGETWTPQSQGNKIGKFDVALETISEVVLDHTVTGTGSFESEKSYGFVADFYANVVYRLDLDTDTTEQIISGFDKPVDIIYGQGPAAQDRAIPYVINYGNGTISRLALADNSIADTIGLGATSKPIKAVYDENTSAIWTANFGTNNVSKVTVNRETLTYSIETFAVDDGPHDILLDGDYVYVVCSQSNTVSRIHTGTEVIDNVLVGEVPWSITQDTTHLYVTNTYDKTVSRIDKASFNVTDTYTDFGDLPDGCIVIGSDLYVSDFENGVMYEKVAATGSATASHTWPTARVYDIDKDRDDDTIIYSALFYPNTPSRFAQRDYDFVNSLTFSPIYSLDVEQTVTSNAVAITDIDQILPVSIEPNLFNAQLVINGSPVGASSTVENGDTVAVQMDSDDEYDTLRTVSVTVGDIVTTFEVKTVGLNAVPEGFTFPSVFNSNINNYVNGTTHTIEKIDVAITLDVTASPDTGTTDLVKNEVLSGTSETYNLNDTISIRDYTAPEYQTTNIYIIDTGVFDLPWVTQTSVHPDSEHLHPGQLNLLPVEFNSNAGELDPTDVTIYVTDLTSEITSTVNIDTSLPGSPDPGEYNNTDDYILFADYLGDRVIRLDTDGNPVQEITGALDKPYDVTFIPRVGDTSPPTKVAVSSSGNDTVYVYDRDTWTVEHTISVGARPLGISGSQEIGSGFEFYVCCYDDDKVQRVTYNGSTFNIVDIQLPVGSGPVACELHTSGYKVFVTCFKTNKIVTIDGSILVNSNSTDVSPISVVSAADDVFVANMGSNVISWHNKDGELIHRFDTYGGVPVNLALDGTTLYVTNMQSLTGSVSEYDVSVQGTATLVRSFQMPSHTYLYGSALGNNKLLTLRQYPARDSRTINSLPYPATLASIPGITNATRDTTVDVGTFFATGANNYPIRMRTPGLFNSRFVVNDEEVGIDTWVYPTDELKLRVDLTSVPDYLHNVPVIFEGKIYDVTILSEPDLDPDPLVFGAVGGLFTFEYGYSNVVTITGMTDGAQSPVVAEPFVGVILNGTDITNSDETQTTEFFIENGDELQIYGHPGRPYGSTALRTIDVHGVEYSFEVTSLTLNNAETQNFYVYDSVFGVLFAEPETQETKIIVANASEYDLTQSISKSVDLEALEQFPAASTANSNQIVESYEITYGIDVSTNVESTNYSSVTIDSLTYSKEILNTYYLHDFVDLFPTPSAQRPMAFIGSSVELDRNTVIEYDFTFDHTTNTSHKIGTNVEPLVNNEMFLFEIPNNQLDFIRFDRRRFITSNYQRLSFPMIPVIDTSSWIYWLENSHSEFIDQQVERYTLEQVTHGITVESYYWDQVTHGITVEKDLFTNYHTYIDAVFDTGITYGLHYHGTSFDSYVINITTAPEVSFDHIPGSEILLHGTSQETTALKHFEIYNSINFERTRRKFVPSSMPSPVKDAFVRQQGVAIYAILKFETAESSRIIPNYMTPIKDDDPWYDNTPQYSVSQKHYFSSQQDAINDGISNGYDEEDIITVEVEPGGWIWGYTITDYTNACDADGYRIRGWIRGG